MVSGMDAAELQPPPDRVTTRRSKRRQSSALSAAEYPTKIASTDPSKLAVSPPKQNVANYLASRSSAKPQGILKRQSAKTTGGKARRK